MLVQEFINNHIINGAPITQCMRTEKCELAYQEHLQNCEDTPDKYIMNKFFSDNTIPHCFAMNEYPYTFDDYSQHYILWINPLYEREYHIGSNLPNDVKQNINNIINNDDNNVDAFIVFENSKSCRTINSVRHFHVIFYNETHSL